MIKGSTKGNLNFSNQNDSVGEIFLLGESTQGVLQV
jgi:hypothetical protein